MPSPTETERQELFDTCEKLQSVLGKQFPETIKLSKKIKNLADQKLLSQNDLSIFIEVIKEITVPIEKKIESSPCKPGISIEDAIQFLNVLIKMIQLKPEFEHQFKSLMKAYLFGKNQLELQRKASSEEANVYITTKNPTNLDSPKSTTFSNVKQFKSFIDQLKNTTNPEDILSDNDYFYRINIPDRTIGKGACKNAGFNEDEIKSTPMFLTFLYDKAHFYVIGEIENKLSKKNLGPQSVSERYRSHHAIYWIAYQKDLWKLAYPFLQLHSNLTRNLNIALDNLEEAIKNPAHPTLANMGQKTLDQIRKIVTSEELNDQELSLLTDAANQSANVVKEPSFQNIADLHQTSKKIFDTNDTKREWGKVLGSSLLALVGASLLVAAAISLSAATFGIATPFIALGLAVAGAIFIPTGAITSKLSSNSLFAKKQKRELTFLTEQLVSQGKETLKQPKKPKQS